ncbi:hypothetical protein BDP27DRAFT_1362317 [Rhodocollybia butyracea]|uniref:Secreted protein n=1 Tax=Rhodocollybia butyracea TaxID=206335 RepID=A0A9P5PYL4_9AGAR|nr:hypothetical protein BDP27DRAFT_1362317 [Rhodocollybia butyracea]
MKPRGVRPKMKKMILTGFVACTSASASPSPNSSSTASSNSSPCSRRAGSTEHQGTSSANSNSGTPPVPPPRPSSFSLGLGQIDYAAAGIARRVSRIFHRRMSAQSTQTAQMQMHLEEESEVAEKDKGLPLVPVIESELPTSDFDSGDGDEREVLLVRDGEPDVPTVALVEDKDVGAQGSRDQDEAEIQETTGTGALVSPDIRACRWGCF